MSQFGPFQDPNSASVGRNCRCVSSTSMIGRCKRANGPRKRNEFRFYEEVASGACPWVCHHEQPGGGWALRKWLRSIRLAAPSVLARGVLSVRTPRFLDISRHFTVHLFRPWIPNSRRANTSCPTRTVSGCVNSANLNISQHFTVHAVFPVHEDDPRAWRQARGGFSGPRRLFFFFHRDRALNPVFRRRVVDG